jgi:hypothetical protein
MNPSIQENKEVPAFEVGQEVRIMVDNYESYWCSSHEEFSTGQIEEIKDTENDDFIFAYLVKIGTLGQWHPFNEIQLVSLT